MASSLLARLIHRWVYGGGLAGVLLLLLTPLLCAGWSPALTATFLLLPAYMLHQLEEHDRDRFRLFFNATIGQGHAVLSPRAVFLTNVPGVWGVIALSLYLATELSVGWALIAVDLVLVNAAVHLAHAIAFRRSNPGLVTAVLLFLPLGLSALALILRSGLSSPMQQGVSLAIAIGIHVAILLHVKQRLARCQRRADRAIRAN